MKKVRQTDRQTDRQVAAKRVRLGLVEYCQAYNISRTLVGNKIVGHSDVVAAAPTAPTTSCILDFNTWLQ